MKGEFIRFRLSKQDKQFLQIEASKNKLKLSAYVRNKLLNK